MGGKAGREGGRVRDEGRKRGREGGLGMKGEREGGRERERKDEETNSQT